MWKPNVNVSISNVVCLFMLFLIVTAGYMRTRPAPTTSCGNNTGICHARWKRTARIFWTCQQMIGPQSEKCDGFDNDCDGVVDNGFGIGTACGNGGTTECADSDNTRCSTDPGGSRDPHKPPASVPRASDVR